MKRDSEGRLNRILENMGVKVKVTERRFYEGTDDSTKKTTCYRLGKGVEYADESVKLHGFDNLTVFFLDTGLEWTEVKNLWWVLDKTEVVLEGKPTWVGIIVVEETYHGITNGKVFMDPDNSDIAYITEKEFDRITR